MPYQLEWFDAPEDKSLPVLDALPNGVAERTRLFGPREAWGTPADGWFRRFHFCHHCGGWIEGDANEYHENTLDSAHLAGRRGKAYHCLRCGREIAFFGAVS